MPSLTKPSAEPMTNSELDSFSNLSLVPEQDPAEERLARLKAFRESPEGINLVSWVRSEHKRMSTAREADRKQWQLNLAFYNGLHDAQLVNGSATVAPGSVYVPPRARNSNKQMINRIRSTVRTELAKLTSQKPGVSVVPASSDEEDLFAAMAGEQVYQSIAVRRDLRTENNLSMFWLSITGNGFLKTYWDDSLLDEDSDVYGDVNYQCVSPFNLFVPDLNEPQIERQPYVLHMFTKSTDYVRWQYEQELEGREIHGSVTPAESLVPEAAYKTGDNVRDKSAVMVYEMWIKPGGCRLLPEGGYVTVIDDVLVDYSDTGLPYEHGNYPFTHYAHIPTGKFYAASVLEDLIPLQKEYNKIRTQIAESRVKMGKPQFAAPRGSISAAKMTNEIGLVIEYMPGMQAPVPMPLSNMPTYIVQEQDRVLSDMEDISGQHQVSKGQAPAGITAATAISFLQEKDDSYMGVTFANVEKGAEKIGRSTLSLAVQYWDEERMVKVTGPAGQFDAQMLDKSRFARGTDLRVEGGSALPESKAAKNALIMDMMKLGFIPVDQGLEMMSMGGSKQLMEQLQIDQRQAQRENIRLKTLDPQTIMENENQWQQQVQQVMAQAQAAGADPSQISEESLESPSILPVNEWDNHDVHIVTHDNFRKSQAFELLDDAIKEQFDKHVKAHKAKKQEQVLQELMSQIPEDGSLGEGPEAPEEEAQPGEEAGAPPADESAPEIPQDESAPSMEAV